MNAKEARSIAKSKNTDESNTAIANITNSITIAANKGAYETFYYKSINADVMGHFKTLGYTIEKLPDDPRESGSTYRITW